MATGVVEKTNRKIGDLDFVHLKRLQGEDGWRISDIESFRGGLSDALYGNDFDQELGIYDRQFRSQDDAYDFARQILDAHSPLK
jgi:hypothetical protein